MIHWQRQHPRTHHLMAAALLTVVSLLALPQTSTAAGHNRHHHHPKKHRHVTVKSHGGPLRAQVGALQVSAPKGAIRKGQSLTIEAALTKQPTPGASSIAGGPYAISTSQGEPSKPVTVTFSYKPALLHHGDKPLVLHRSTSVNGWVPLRTNVDSKRHIASATVSSFSFLDVVDDSTGYASVSSPCETAFPDARRKTIGRTTWYNRQESMRMVLCYRFGLNPSADFPISASMVCGMLAEVVGHGIAEKLGVFTTGACSGAELASDPGEPTKYIGAACSWASTLLKSVPAALGCTFAPSAGTALGSLFESKHELDVAVDVAQHGKCIKYSPTHFGSPWLADNCAPSDPGFSSLHPPPTGGGGGGSGGGGVGGGGEGPSVTGSELTDVLTMGSGDFQTCAIQSARNVVCWGANAAGGATSATPVAQPDIGAAASIAGGLDHFCAVLVDETVVCWGDNEYGQLGNGSTISNWTEPTQVTGLSGVRAVANGGFFSCALLSTGHIACWGEDQYGQLGDGNVIDSNTPVPVSGIADATAVALGTQHACALIAGGTVHCWGRDSSGQLGDESTEDSSVPMTVATIEHAASIGSGDFHSCAVLTNGEMRCWGDNYYGELGDGSQSLAQTTPVAVSGVDSAVRMVGGFLDSCALLKGGTIDCWGRNADGELGDGTTEFSTTPVPVVGLSEVEEIGMGEQHACARNVSGVYCWGSNQYGQLGNGTTEDSSVPVPVSAIG